MTKHECTCEDKDEPGYVCECGEYEQYEDRTDDRVNIEVTEEPEFRLTENQIHGINSGVVRLIGRLKQYGFLTSAQMQLVDKSPSIQPFLREIHRYEETRVVNDVREAFDTFYVYAAHHDIVMHNVSTVREKFEQAITFLATEMSKVEDIMEKDYLEILDTFGDMIGVLIQNISEKPIFDENFKFN